MADCLQQVRLAQPGRPVEEQRVVQATRCRSHALCRRKREAVRRTDDERLERVALTQARSRDLVANRRHAAHALQHGRPTQCQLGPQRLEPNIEGLAGQLRQRAHDQWAHPLLEPFRDEFRLGAEYQRVVVEPQPLRALEPAFVVGLGDVLSEMAQRLLPQLCCVTS